MAWDTVFVREREHIGIARSIRSVCQPVQSRARNSRQGDNDSQMNLHILHHGRQISEDDRPRRPAGGIPAIPATPRPGLMGASCAPNRGVPTTARLPRKKIERSIFYSLFMR
jgi:hypothetical protein